MQTILPISTSSDEEIKALLKKYSIGLTVEESKKIVEMLGRDPYITEAVIWGIQGSEHCSYKSSRRFLKQFLTDGKHIILGPKEDSGIVALTDGPAGKRWGVVVSHESHNHPSQIVPYEGAATGVGGVVRDVLCMGARVVGCVDNLRLGDGKTNESRNIAKEVARGIAGYGNPLGIPNLGGDTIFDSVYNNNCLVNALAVGIIREDEIIHSTVPDEAAEVGYDIILYGKPTDRSGFGGAAFASVSMEEEKKEQNSGAVQEPNPFLERHLLASTYALFDWLKATDNLHRVSFKDLGAGGVVCASLEQVANKNFGAEVNLDDVHVSIQDLPPEVIACAETQERLCWMCHPDLTQHILDHYNKVWDLPSVAEHAGARVIGKVTKENIYRLRHKGEIVCEAKSKDLAEGLQYVRPTVHVESSSQEPDISCEGNTISYNGKSWTLKDVFMAMLSHPNGASKSPILRHYDKDVIGNGIIEAGEADASVIAPLQDIESYVHEGTHPDWDIPKEDIWKGIAIASDGKGRYGRISPYLQGLNAAVEAMRNVVAVGGTPRALTDCLNFGNPEIPEQLAALEEGVKGIADAARGITFKGEPVPVISGNVSLYNSLPNGDAIDPTAVVAAIGVVPDAREAVTMNFKKANSVLLLIGERKDECGGSAYYEVLEELAGAERNAALGKNVPHPDLETATKEMNFVLDLIHAKKVLSCHDISDGGLLMALFEMTLPIRKMGGVYGFKVDISGSASPSSSDKLLLSETGGFVLEMDALEASEALKKAEKDGISMVQLGGTTSDASIEISRDGMSLISGTVSQLKDVWANGLKKIF